MVDLKIVYGTVTLGFLGFSTVTETYYESKPTKIAFQNTLDSFGLVAEKQNYESGLLNLGTLTNDLCERTEIPSLCDLSNNLTVQSMLYKQGYRSDLYMSQLVEVSKSKVEDAKFQFMIEDDFNNLLFGSLVVAFALYAGLKLIMQPSHIQPSNN